MAGLLDYFNRGAGALAGGDVGNYGGLLDEQQRQEVQRAQQMALAAQLLDAGGPSTQRTSLGQALGRGMSAAGQARQGSIDQALQAALLRKQLASAGDQEPSAVREYEYAKKNGFKGSFDEWKRVASAQPQAPSSIQEYEYFTKLTPEQQKQFMSIQRNPVVPQLSIVNGVPSLVDRTATDPSKAVTPLTTQDAEIQAIIRKAIEEARAKEKGAAIGAAEGSVEKKAIGAMNVLEKLDLADPLIDAATGSLAGAGVDKLASAFGSSPSGDQAIAQLKVLQADLMTSMPRMEGPQSDRDVELYRQAAGELGDPTVPRARKKAAVQMIRALQMKYAEAGTAQPAGAPMGKSEKRPPLSSFNK